MPTVRESALNNVVREILQKAGSDEQEAAIVAEHLVRSNLCGHDSHGVGMIPAYIEHIAAGVLKPNMPAKLVKDDSNILIFDGQLGYGQRTASEAMSQTISRCKEKGVALMTLRNAHHIGRVGAYGEQSINAGLESLHFVNVIGHKPVVLPHGGRDGRYSTNPLCVAIPGTEKTDAILLDMATSRMAMGKVRVAMEAGKTLDDHLVVDPDGNPTNDPSVMFNDPLGALFPFGEYKGYGIALVCELLGGVLAGGGTCLPKTQTIGGIINNMLAVVIDPKRLVEQDWMRRELDEMVRYVKASPPHDPDMPVMVAGDPERESFLKRQKEGVPLSPGAWEKILLAAERVGIPRSRVTSLIE